MTRQEWDRERRRLSGAIGGYKQALLRAETMDEKLAARRRVDGAREALRRHKLNYWTMVNA